jgi:hypothetical protein
MFTTHNPVPDDKLFPTDDRHAIQPVEDRWESDERRRSGSNFLFISARKPH